MAETFHIGDTVSFTATADNIDENIDGDDGQVENLDFGLISIAGPGYYIAVRDPADITLIDCPHQEHQP